MIVEHPQDRYLSTREVAELFGVSMATVRKWVSEDRLPKPTVINQRVHRWRLSDVDRQLSISTLKG